MSSSGTRRGRSGRGAALRLASDPSFELRSLLTDRRSLARLTLGLVTVAALTAAVQGWKHDFPFRLNQRPEDGIAAVIDFQRVNRERTARARDRAAEQVPPVFRRDSKPLSAAAQELGTGLLSFLPAADVSKLPAETRRAFGLAVEGNQPPSGGLPAGDRNESFQRLKQIAADDKKLRDVIADFKLFMKQLEEKTGLIRPEHVMAEVNATGQISVLDAQGELQTVNLSDVQLQSLLAPTGLLYKRWAICPSLAPIRNELEHWLKVQSPESLTYDDQATQNARLTAANEQEPVRDFYIAGNLLVKPGELIDENLLELLQLEYDALDARVGIVTRTIRVAIVFVLILVLAGLIGHYLVRNEPALIADLGRLSLYLGMCVLSVALARGLSFDPWRAEVGPILVCVMVCAVVYSQMLATLTAFALCLIVTVSTGGDLGRFTVLMSVCARRLFCCPPFRRARRW